MQAYQRWFCPLLDPSFQMSIVGLLQYATITHPEISFDVYKVWQYRSSPLHWTAVNHILRYLKGTTTTGLYLLPFFLHPSP